MAGILLRSVAFNDHDRIPARFARDGGNVSPPLEWGDVPDSTSELVLLVEDPDAGRTPFLHWLVTGIEPVPGGVAEGQVPVGGREWTNGFGATGWGGPHPPAGDDPHRYFFRLYALRKPIDLADPPDAAAVHDALKGQEMASGTMVGTFAR
ncbi:YbhB/YbcL family Raf kinase inhibitor-like protein [Micromonospora sp. CPCC 206060]|uniref:YbhB/YbcL family Raf kinase inhibitor-like protein n=1 Tax=Micromonospora sp. CPCC 206060 TaxID=3122406 RepID=UPI002FF3C107